MDDGGQAFPTIQHTYVQGIPVIESYFGMTLRDYFAARAMQAMITFGRDGWDDDDIANECYKMADAMLEARKA